MPFLDGGKYNSGNNKLLQLNSSSDLLSIRLLLDWPSCMQEAAAAFGINPRSYRKTIDTHGDTPNDAQTYHEKGEGLL